MKHYVMAFFILFSALSSSWVGAMASEHTHSQSMKISQAESMSMQHDMSAHDCCPSMQKASKELEKVASLGCPSCGDDCQCDSNVCHSSSFSLATLTVNRFSFQVLTEHSVAAIQSNLPKAPVSLEIRPPKSA